LEGSESVALTVSIGIATAKDDDDVTLEKLLERADQALYEAKRTGRDKVCLADNLGSE
jgi:diguanylate cyclase